LSGDANAWEPRINLSDTALLEANQFDRPLKMSRRKRVVGKKPLESERSAHFVDSPFVTSSTPKDHHLVNGGIIDAMTMRSAEDKEAKEDSFISLWAKNRLLKVQCDLAENITSLKP
jgi:hypothetical protein